MATWWYAVTWRGLGVGDPLGLGVRGSLLRPRGQWPVIRRARPTLLLRALRLILVDTYRKQSVRGIADPG